MSVASEIRFAPHLSLAGGDLNRAWKERLQRALSRLRCALQFLACSRRFLLRLKPQPPKRSPAPVSSPFLLRLIFFLFFCSFWLFRRHKNDSDSSSNRVR